jgi:hypothetical protein
MKFISHLYSAIDKVSGLIKRISNKAGESISGLIETVGSGLFDVLDQAGSGANIKLVFNWLGSILKGIADICGSAVKGAFNITGGFTAGLIRLTGGTVTFKPPMIVRGLFDIISPIAGTLIVVSAKILSTFQALFLLQAFERRLYPEEIEPLKKVFKKSLPYRRIRIVEGRAGLFSLNARAFTLAHTVFLKKSSPRLDLLVHECTHIWQYRHLGVNYSSDALGAQFFIKDAYNWELEIETRMKKEWKEFNMESQAEFLQDLWRMGHRTIANGNRQRGNGVFFDIDWANESGAFTKSDKNYTSVARQAELTLWNT